MWGGVGGVVICLKTKRLEDTKTLKQNIQNMNE